MEGATWIGIGLVAAAYITQRHRSVAKVTLEPPPSAQNEVDPTRWRHDGSQPLNYGDFMGNRPRNDTSYAKEAEIMEALAF